MMNFPGVIAGDPAEMAKLSTGLTDHVDGHAPGVRGPALNAYVAAGIRSDHEATTYEEALEKRRLGMWVMLREASIARNLRDLLPLVKKFGTDRCMFCTDDREPGFIVEEGHINQMVRVAVSEGIRPGDPPPITGCGTSAPSPPATRPTSSSSTTSNRSSLGRC